MYNYYGEHKEYHVGYDYCDVINLIHSFVTKILPGLQKSSQLMRCHFHFLILFKDNKNYFYYPYSY